MAEKIVKGIRLSNSEDNFVLSSKNDDLVSELNATISALQDELAALKGQYNTLKDEVDALKYDQEHSGNSNSGSSLVTNGN